MSFVAELVRSADNAELLGEITRVRVFVDYQGFSVCGDTSTYAIRLTLARDPARRIIEWEPALLAELEQRFGTSDYGGTLRGSRYPLAAESRTLVDWSLMPFTPEGLQHDRVSAWFDIQEAAGQTLLARHPGLVGPQEVGDVLGGHPVWIQSAEPHDLPFFLQLNPPREFGWGDAGVLYLFLDRDDPRGGVVLLGQMS